MDGVDVSLIKTDGHKILEFGDSITIPYEKYFKQRLKILIEKKGGVDKDLLKNIEDELTETHARAVKTILMRQNISRTAVDIIGFHGHTLEHRPFDKFTWQIGNGQLLANITRINVVNNFRQKDIENNGNGAPLLPIYHKAIIDSKHYPACILNIGGVANITYIDEENLIAFDSGAGNALIDDFLSEKTGLNYDSGGKIALSGEIIPELLEVLKGNSFFSQKPPKSLDRNDFKGRFINWLQDNKDKKIRNIDIVATLSEFTVHGVMESFKYLPQKPKVIFVCGGGVYNKYFLSKISEQTVIETKSISQASKGLDPDAIEAQGFAFMATRHLLKLPISFKQTTGIKSDNIILGDYYSA